MQLIRDDVADSRKDLGNLKILGVKATAGVLSFHSSVCSERPLAAPPRFSQAWAPVRAPRGLSLQARGLHVADRLAFVKKRVLFGGETSARESC